MYEEYFEIDELGFIQSPVVYIPYSKLAMHYRKTIILLFVVIVIVCPSAGRIADELPVLPFIDENVLVYEEPDRLPYLFSKDRRRMENNDILSRRLICLNDGKKHSKG